MSQNFLYFKVFERKIKNEGSIWENDALFSHSSDNTNKNKKLAVVRNGDKSENIYSYSTFPEDKEVMRLMYNDYLNKLLEPLNSNEFTVRIAPSLTYMNEDTSFVEKILTDEQTGKQKLYHKIETPDFNDTSKNPVKFLEEIATLYLAKGGEIPRDAKINSIGDIRELSIFSKTGTLYVNGIDMHHLKLQEGSELKELINTTFPNKRDDGKIQISDDFKLSYFDKLKEAINTIKDKFKGFNPK